MAHGSNEVEGFPKERLGALCDGIFAIAMTILVLDLKVPEATSNADATFRQGFIAMIPQIQSLVISFVVLAGFWITNSSLLGSIERVTYRVLWAFVYGLLPIILIPFTTSLIGSAPGSQVAVLAFALNVALSAFALILVAWLIRSEVTDLTPNGPTLIAQSVGYNWIKVIVCLAAVVISLIDPNVAGYVFLAFLFLFGFRRVRQAVTTRKPYA
ncbi:MAG: TMEM175 family protein [Fimbriimonadaceae bacterium]